MSKIFEQLLRQRGYDRSFLQPKYEECIDARQLPDVEKAVQRLKTAISRGEKVLIYGDYDVDGVTASTALFDALQLAGLKEVEIMLPNRFTDGYGMSKKVVQRAKETGVGLVMTVDCGSRNQEIVAELNEQKIDTIVTDHHECGETLPEAVAVVNPKRTDVEVATDLKNLAGVGVVFKLVQAMVQAGMVPNGQEKWLLDLVAIGTVCDSMPLTGENRRLCRYGMLVLEKTRRPGLRELIRKIGVKQINSETIGFLIGPRLNAAGRMETAELALKLLMSKRRTEAASLALMLESLNDQRKKQQDEALRQIQKAGEPEDPVMIVKGDWHEGVLGIIAGRLMEIYAKPAFVLAEVNGVIKGSGRSFGEFNLAEALDACREYILKGGGHAAACGVTLATDGLEKFRAAMNQYYKSLKLTNQKRFLEVKEDLTVTNFEELTLELLEEMRDLEPYGDGNQEPVFLLDGVRVVDVARLGAEGNHLRLTVWDTAGKGLKLMEFHAPKEHLGLMGGEVVNAWVTLTENEFRGIRSIEGRIIKLA